MKDETETETAAYYEAHKGDLEEWAEPEPPRTRRRLASMISVRLSPREAVVIKDAATRNGMSISAFIRAAALSAALGESRGRLVRQSETSLSTQSESLQLSLKTVPQNADTWQIGGSGVVSSLP